MDEEPWRRDVDSVPESGDVRIERNGRTRRSERERQDSRRERGNEKERQESRRERSEKQSERKSDMSKKEESIRYRLREGIILYFCNKMSAKQQNMTSLLCTP